MCKIVLSSLTNNSCNPLACNMCLLLDIELTILPVTTLCHFFDILIDSQNLHVWIDTLAREYPTLESICFQCVSCKAAILTFQSLHVRHIEIHFYPKGKTFFFLALHWLLQKMHATLGASLSFVVVHYSFLNCKDRLKNIHRSC